MKPKPAITATVFAYRILVPQVVAGAVCAGRASDGRTEPQPLAWIRSGEAWTDLSFTVQGAAWLNAIGPDAGGTLWGVGTAFPENATLDGLVVRGCPGA